MKTLWWVSSSVLLSVAAASCGGGNLPSAPASTATVAASPAGRELAVSNTFLPNDTTISTSEGAPYGFCDFWASSTAYCGHESNFGYGPTKVIQVYICLSGEVSVNSCSQQPAVTGPLSAAMLRDIDARLATYEGTGMRLLLRFTYNFGPIGPTAMDAPITVIARHIEQLAPIVKRHRDLIFALEAGFIGTWGEWHDSTHGNDTASAHRIVLAKERDQFGNLFPILVRTAGELVQFTGDLSPQGGLGIHDDYYASSALDANTWNPCGAHNGYCFTNYTASQLESYGAAVSTTTMFAGEFGALYPPLQTCDALAAYSYTYHAQSISIHPLAAVGSELQSEGCALSFYNKIGTRIELRSATITGTVRARKLLEVAVTLVNTGFGRVLRARPVSLVFLSNGSEVARIPVPLAELDLRQLASSPAPVARTFQFRVKLPDTFPSSGAVSAALLIPDPAPSLTSQAAYALPLNSVDQNNNPVFDAATGYNVIATLRTPSGS